MNKRPLKHLIHAALFVALAPLPLGATGYYGPNEYLALSSRDMVLAPEFYWDLEVKRLAGSYQPAEKFLLASLEPRNGWTAKSILESLGMLTASADSTDFAEALRTGAITPPDTAKATAQHEAVRALLTEKELPALLPAEFASEFADYHRGALAYRRGKEHWDEARAAWETLLKRPKEERHYRSVWATFMLGKIAMKRGEPQAVELFQQTRALAQAGFADSLGLAADSYGWEARSEWKQGHPEKAAPLYLTQLALGDESAINSLKALIPDRKPIDGLLNYGPTGNGEREATSAEDAAAARQLMTAASDPLLRRLVTVHILATETDRGYVGEVPDGVDGRCARWLQILKKVKPAVLEDAEYLGWVAYTSGNYHEAAEWLKLANPDTPASCWLRSKFERRAGKLADAQASMAKAFQVLRETAAYTRWSPAEGREDADRWPGSPESWTFRGAAAGNLGALHLERAEFVDALETFMTGGLWSDAAFIAERILTADELMTFVEKLAPPAAGPDATAGFGGRDQPGALRYLLGRRLVREDRYDEARHYLKAPYDKILADYVQALEDGANEKLPKARRARAWFHAAWLARYDGMELMGTEGDPDGFVSRGAFASSDLVNFRTHGADKTWRAEHGLDHAAGIPIAPKPTEEELQRFKRNRISPERRFHYRVIAAALAMRAAAMLPDNTEELANVINCAGWWVSSTWGDQQLANKYYRVLEKRCASTEGARPTLEKGRFEEQGGPWSTEETTARAARKN